MVTIRFSLVWRQIITMVLVVQTIIMEPVSLLAQTKHRPPAATLTEQILSTQALNVLAENDLHWREFIQANQETSSWKLPFDMSDPAIDQDPFFLRAQKWTQTLPKNQSTKLPGGFTFAKKAGELQFGFSATRRLLKVNLPLTPFAVTREFIFFSVDQESRMFEVATGEGQKPGEGIFFINRADVENPTIPNSPVPFFFFPLPGQNWTGKIDAIEFPQTDALAIANREDTAIHLDLRDVDTLMKGQKINLMLAAALSVNEASANSKDFIQRISQPGNPILPRPGSTAAFGLFLTSLPGAIQENTYSLHSHQSIIDKAVAQVLQQLAHSPLLKFLLPNTANAMDIPPDVLARLIYIGSVLVALLAAGVVAKYTLPSLKKKIRANRSEQQPVTLAGKVKREVIENIDVFAHSTMTSHQLNSVSFGNSLEIFLDRFAPTVAAADHTIVRRFLKNTYYFSRDSIKKSPVDAKVFFLGALVMGSVDTSSVFLQYFFVVPWMAMTVAPFLDSYWEQKIDHAFDPQNPNTREMAIVDTIRNGVSYLQNGASHYATDSRMQIIEGVTKDVMAEMRAQGKDPMAPENQALLNRLIDQKTDLLLQQRGLPAQSKFLFDANTLFEVVPKTLGYSPTAAADAADSFILAKRFGLTKKAMDRAIELARKNGRNRPSPESTAVVRLLEDVRSKMGLISNGITHGVEGIKTAREVRQALTLLSYEGPIDLSPKYVPEIWSQQYTSEIAQVAALYFRQSLYSLLQKQGPTLAELPLALAEEVAAKAQSNIVSQMSKDDPDLIALKPEEALKAIKATRHLEFESRLQIEVQRLVRKEVSRMEAESYTPPKQDFMTRRQLRKAHERSDKTVGQKVLSDVAEKKQTSTENDLLAYKQSEFTKELAHEVGLNLESDVLDPDQKRAYEEMLKIVEKKAEATVIGQIENDPNLKTYLEKLSPTEQARLKISLYGISFLAAYREATTQQQLISPLHPHQPGAFQSLRQTRVVAKSPLLTRTIRSLESFMDDQALHLGWEDTFNRRVPLFQDLWSNHRRLLKTFLPMVTTTYLWNYYVWNLNMPYGTWMIFALTSAASMAAPSQFLSRLFRMNGVKVMDSVPAKVAYAIPYAWLTFFGMFPMAIFASDANAIVKSYLTDPFMSAFSQIDPQMWAVGGGMAGLAFVTAKAVGTAKESLASRKYHRDMSSKPENKQALSSRIRACISALSK